MVEEQAGLRSNQPRELPLWTKLFSGFKVAKDPKKLLLAAAGILVMSMGWYVLSLIFYGLSRDKPDWEKDYRGNSVYASDAAAWRAFKQDRMSWNLRYAMAAPVPSTADLSDSARKPIIYYDEFDAWDTYDRYEKVHDELTRLSNPVRIVGVATPQLVIESKEAPKAAITLPKDAAEAAKLEALSKDNKLKAKDLAVRDSKLTVAGMEVTVNSAADLEKLQKYLAGAKTVDKVRSDAREHDDEVTLKALDYKTYDYLRPAGQFRTWPWFEYRGPNPFLLITGDIKQTNPPGKTGTVPWAGIGFLRWFAVDEVPVLLEPLVKFLRPIVYLLYPAAGGWNRIYLLLIILWTLATWALFGGAITRMAAVEVARTNEKVGMTEALRFAWSRIMGYFSAPVVPLIALAIFTILLWLYGLAGAWTLFVGDIVIYGLLAPIMLLLGLIMAVVLVGLVGWPLMYSTISAEGSDNFDAISRSYSYVYQAPWHYIWYSLVALVYGAVLVFFVGLMGSLTVYLGKWGISQAPALESRAPTYLFIYAPTSFEWRDLLLHGSSSVKQVPVAQNNGTQSLAYEPTKAYWDEMTWYNYLAAFLMMIWLYLLFLLVLGFGYSYFWSASTIIYLLMRLKVDDTELDEIHLEEEELEEPYSPPAKTPEASAEGAKSMSAGAPVTMVESPTLRTPSSGGANPPGTSNPTVVTGPASVPSAVVNPPPATEGPVVAPPPGGNKETPPAGEGH